MLGVVVGSRVFIVVRRRTIALQDDGTARGSRRGLHPVHEVDEVIRVVGRREIDVEEPVANLGHDGRRRRGVVFHDFRGVGTGFDGQRRATRKRVGGVARLR